MSALFSSLFVTTLLENSAADKLIFFPDNRAWHFMQIAARKKCQSLFFSGKKKKKKGISKYHLRKFLPSMLSGKCFFCVWRWCLIILVHWFWNLFCHLYWFWNLSCHTHWFLNFFCHIFKYLGRQVWANSVDPEKIDEKNIRAQLFKGSLV